MRLPCFLRSILALALPALAFGSTLVSTCVIPTSTAPISVSCVLNTFLPVSGRTLTGITLAETFTTTAEISVYNNTPAPQPFTGATVVIPFTVISPFQTNPVFSFASSAGPVAGVASASPPPTVVSAAATVTSSTLVVDPSTWAIWTSPPSTISLTIASRDGIYSGSAIPGMFFGGTASAGGSLSVIYSYTTPETVPEPATMAMVGGGLILAGFLGKRRK